MTLDIIYIGRLPPFRAGSAVITAQLLRGLARAGHGVRAITDCMDRLAHLTDAARAAMPELSITYFPTPDWPMLVKGSGPPEYRQALSHGARSHLLQHMERRRPDVVLFGIEQHGPGVIDAAVDRGVPCAMMSHGPVLAILDGQFEKDAAARMMDAIMQTDLLYACATHAADRMKSAHLPPVELIANSVDTTLFQDRPKNAALLEELGIGAHERVILHVSNYAEAKRTRDLIASAATVLRHRADVSYLFVGDSKRQPDLERQVDLAGIRDKCRFVDWVPHAAMPDHYGIADIVVSTSHSEVLSLVYLEAQACGRLLLASDIQAAREVIADGHTGLLFGAGNVDDLTEKTLTVLDDADLRARIGRAARQFAVTNRDLGDAVARYETTLRRLVERRCPAPAR